MKYQEREKERASGSPEAEGDSVVTDLCLRAQIRLETLRGRERCWSYSVFGWIDFKRGGKYKRENGVEK